MKHIMILAFIVFISAIVAIAFLMGSRLTAPTGFAVAESEDENISEIPSFRLYTKAVCNLPWCFSNIYLHNILKYFHNIKIIWINIWMIIWMSFKSKFNPYLSKVILNIDAIWALNKHTLRGNTKTKKFRYW